MALWRPRHQSVAHATAGSGQRLTHGKEAVGEAICLVSASAAARAQTAKSTAKRRGIVEWSAQAKTIGLA